MENNKCVYIYLDHRKPGEYIYDNLMFDFEPIYVGMGSKTRPDGHKYNINKRTRFYNKYNKIIKETNKSPEYVILYDNISEKDAKYFEIETIKIIGKIEDGGTLTNITDGGDQHSGFKLTREVIEKRTKTIKNDLLYKIKRKNKFINKSIILHNNYYDYSLVDYIDAKTNVKIICPIHGEFEISPTSHLMGSGCQKCAGNHKHTKEEFILISNNIHYYKYDYIFVEYKNNKSKVKIICPIHGVFEQTPGQHMKGHGCRKCGSLKSAITRSKKPQ